MVRPNPAPPVAREREVSIRTKGSKTTLRSASARPGPLSLTCTTTALPCCMATTEAPRLNADTGQEAMSDGLLIAKNL